MVRAKDLIATLEFQQWIGADEVIEAHPSPKALMQENSFSVPIEFQQKHATNPGLTPPPSQSLHSQAPSMPSARQSLTSVQTLEDLKASLENFSGCALKETALHTVFCDGVANAPVMVIGEAPGADEDQQGRPFVGLSGQLLDRILATIGLNRKKNIYISNIIPWRPPGNRQPTHAEILLCMPFIEKHIALIKPHLLILVGGTATKALLNSNEGIMKLRGNFHTYTTITGDSIPTLATFHPAYLLRSPGQKRLVWLDLLKIKHAFPHLCAFGLDNLSS